MNENNMDSNRITQPEGDIRHFLKVRIADRNIEIECKYRRGFINCRKYLAKFDQPDLIVSAEDEEIKEECRRLIGSSFDEKDHYYEMMEKGVMEEAVIFRKITDAMLYWDTLLMHGAAVAVDNRCYIFTAPSGTGKTTHIQHWLHTIPGSFAVNGDKPMINAAKKLVYGTPWSGKENLNTNTGVPLAGIIHLQRGPENILRPLTFRQMLPCLLQQCYIPADSEKAQLACGLIGLLRDVPCYHLYCTPDEEAAAVAFRGLKPRNSAAV